MRFRPLFRSLLLAVALMPAVGAAQGFTPPSTPEEAKAICDKADLRDVEGLWRFPDDDVMVMIYRNPDAIGRYDMTVVQSSDCSLPAGSKIGEMTETVDPLKFSLSLSTKLKKGKPVLPQKIVATYNDNKESLTFSKGTSLKFRFNPTRLLPYFWRMLSISVKEGETPPEGLIKIYPSYDGNGSSKRYPRYL